MKTPRWRELRLSLENELADETRQRGLGPEERIVWLGDRTSEYLDRWLAFCTTSAASSSACLNSVLFSAIEVATELLLCELKRVQVSPAIVNTWEQFASMLSGLRTQNSTAEAPRLREHLAKARNELSDLIDTTVKRYE